LKFICSLGGINVLRKRISAILFLLIALFGLAIALSGIYFSGKVINDIGVGLETTMDLTLESLDTMTESLELTKNTIGQFGDSLDTVSQVAINVSQTISYTKPTVDQVTIVATADVPESIESIQAAIPNVAEAAGAVDDTLRLLNAFKLERQVFGIPLNFDLGINYAPEAPLDETLLDLGEGLEGVPEKLRGLQPNMEAASENLAVIGQNLDVIGQDLDQMITFVSDFEILLDEYLSLIDDTKELVSQTKDQLSNQIRTAKLFATAVFVWLALFQIVPLYLAYELYRSDEVNFPEKETNQDGE
jgi:hypothetical protein